MQDSTLKKIIIAEDEEDIQKILQFSLQIAGFEIEIYSCGEELLKNIEEFQPDLILLDVMMEGMDGPTTFAKLKQKIPDLAPCIFLTAKTQPLGGAIGIIQKPFNPALLPSQVRELWQKYINNLR